MAASAHSLQPKAARNQKSIEQIEKSLNKEGEEFPHDPKPMLRTYGIGAQILSDLGVRKMRVLSAPKRMQGISGFGLEVTEYVACD